MSFSINIITLEIRVVISPFLPAHTALAWIKYIGRIIRWTLVYI